MGKQLERDLGLPSVMAISIGAMVGSGIFILPGLAMKMAGPAVVLAYFLAALLVLPAALSKSEMATAMPESGGTYLYVERGMGPLLGTIAGVGTWFSLVFKGGLALVGGAPYLVYYLDLPVTPIAIAVAVILIAVNIVGAKQTGRMQIGIVVVMLFVMTWFIAMGTPNVESGQFEGFFTEDMNGLIGATGFVFVSYAGVTKVASVAEEIENPDRNLPLGMLGSLAITTLIYVAIVAVMVGVAPASELTKSDVPMVIAAQEVLPGIGVVAVIVAALLALISTANAGILSSSRYPFAMSRDGLAPDTFENVSDRFKTPVQAITVTGAVLLLLVAFVPIASIAKLASAFQILVFMLINVAVMAFRQGNIEAYEPSFETPLYPVPQIFGILGGFVLLPYMGLVPMVGAAVITAGSILWYYAFVYRRGGVDREGAATDAIRRNLGRRIVDQTESQVERDDYEVLVAVTEESSPDVERSLIDLATDIARSRDGRVRVAQFDTVPDQLPLEQSTELVTDADLAFEKRLDTRATDTDVPIEYGEVVSHDTRHAIVNYANETDADALVLEQEPERFGDSILGDGLEWVENHAPCDVIEMAEYDYSDVDSIAVVTDGQPYDPSKVAIAGSVANQSGAGVDFYYPVPKDSPVSHRNTIQDYLDELEELCDAPVRTHIVETNDGKTPVDMVSDETDIVIVSGRQLGLRERILGNAPDGVSNTSDSGTLVVYGAEQQGTVQKRIAKKVF
jgi:amino acid transporter/nucleotide-binding universal stress UspA family protein